jgi:3-oxoacyl-[acyl-carrier protein] reductase
VLFVSSIAAYRGSGSGAYGGAKAALHPYAHDLARDLGPRGITVNVVAPGYIEDTEFFGPEIAEARRERMIRRHLDRAGRYPRGHRRDPALARVPGGRACHVAGDSGQRWG